MIRRYARIKQRGDTIIEVMLAVSIFALLASGTLAIMNQGTATTIRTLEITQARQSMNDQAELLRYLQQSVVAGTAGPNKATWDTIGTSYVVTKASPFGTSGGQCPASLPSYNPFVLFPSAGTISIQTNNVLYGNGGNSAYPRLQQNGGLYQGTYGLWVEAEKATSSQNYIDFHIRTCWYAPGSGQPITLGTIVRLMTS